MERSQQRGMLDRDPDKERGTYQGLAIWKLAASEEIHWMGDWGRGEIGGLGDHGCGT